MTDDAPEGYRPCVGLALFNAAGLVFMGRRANKGLREHVAPGHEWQMPQGGIDKGETPLEAALRELQEETNVTSVDVLAEAPGWLSYDLPTEIGKQAWKGKWRGQAQKWFALRLTGSEDEIDILNPAGGHKAEFDAWRWAPLAETPALIIPFKQQVYREVASLFAPFAEPPVR
ncbi:MAG: RNA pyrophosphohydrolase [Chelatococcus sp.]|nr:MAG: RNA pyrophosphohydrolase [Chelatococcus sp.]